MPLRFADVCTLLTRLEDTELRDPPLLPSDKSKQLKVVIESWFQSYRAKINELDVDGSVALISTLLPERRTDRVYNIQATRLCRIIGRCLNFSATRTKDLNAYRQSGRGDLATCVERVLRAGGPPGHPPVTLIEVDEMLQVLAGHSSYSAPSIARLPPGSSEARDQVLGNIFKRLEPREAKWLVRLILKDMSPVRMEERLVLRSFHFLLPDLLQFQNDFGAAIELLKGPLSKYPESCDPRSERAHRDSICERGLLSPVIGVKVGKLEMLKARSIDNCMSLLGLQNWVLERKYDGEYCEIHIDMSKVIDPARPEECITIFSKSGKNSTRDRLAIHQTLVECLCLGRPECKIKNKAILLGELIVYSDEDGVQPFDTIRKHVSRSGRFLGTDNDSQPKQHDHLAVVFFDILLLDDKIIMNKPVEERRDWLRAVYNKIPGRAWSTEWKIVDFANALGARKRLMEQFAASIAERHEGLLLKPCGVPYFSLNSSAEGRRTQYIKLKKDYIDGLGDEADFAVVGGSYNAQQANKSGLHGLEWTEFFLGCLTNKNEVIRSDSRPRYKVVASIQQDQCIPRPVLQAANVAGKFIAKPFGGDTHPTNFDIDYGASFKIQHVFDIPLVFEVLGSGFVKPPNCNFHMLRHPRVKKIHDDRSWKDCVSMEELQKQAKSAIVGPLDSESQETRRWVDRLVGKMRKKKDRARTATPRSSSVRTTPTTVRSTITSGVTSAARTDIDGTTLIDNSSCLAKRPREQATETPCPASKRLCTMTAAETDQRHTPYVNIHSIARKSMPLSEINLNAIRAPPTKTSTDKPPPRQPLPSPPPTNPFSEASPCTSLNCPFKDAVLFIPSHHQNSNCRLKCTPHLNNDTLITKALDHWDRASFTHPPGTSTVSESQAYPDQSKIILIDRRADSWREQFLRLVEVVRGFNGGHFRESVGFWDLRALDAPCAEEMVEHFFVGEVMFEEKEERMIWVPGREKVGCLRGGRKALSLSP